VPQDVVRTVADLLWDQLARLTWCEPVMEAGLSVLVKRFVLHCWPCVTAAAADGQWRPQHTRMTADDGFACTHPALCAVASETRADALDAARQRAEGRPRANTARGVPYYTTGDAPCADQA